MNSKLKLSLLLSLSLCLSTALEAKIRLPQIFADHSVLQAGGSACIWGWATPGAEVKLTASWTPVTLKVKADEGGYWVASIPTKTASFTPESLTISEKGSSVTLSDILLGEVWFAMGQSNMEIALNGYNDSPIENANTEIARAASYKGLRFAKVKANPCLSEQDDVPVVWREAAPESLPMVSAAAFFFAKHLSATLGVPIGVVDVTTGGTTVESWTPLWKVKEYSGVDLSQLQGDKFRAPCPVVRYNGMVHPIEGYSAKGFLWYQGEENVWPMRDKGITNPTYSERIASMAEIFRNRWSSRCGSSVQMPFYIVEIAPYMGYSRDRKGRALSGALIREQQNIASKIIPLSGYVCTNDLVYPYETNQIHTCRKEEVGQRLAYLALNKTYGYSTIECVSPEFESMAVKPASEFSSVRMTSPSGEYIIPEGICAELSFSNTQWHQSEHSGGLSPWSGIVGFEIAGADKVFHSATAVVSDKKVIVWSPEVAEPVAVRYGFRDWLPGNLRSARGLPVVPFRTDDWN